MPSITIREFHPESGALLGNISNLAFGTITAGTHSRVKVIDIVFTETSAIGNIKVGLIASGGISVVSNGTGRFGIANSQDFNSTLAASPLSTHFNGVNTSGTSSDENNQPIDNKTDTISNYVYLDIEIGSTNLSAGNGAYKIFFDYA